MQSLAFVTKYDKGKTVTPPFSNYTVVMFVQGDVTVFLELRYFGSKERHKSATLDGAPRRMICVVFSGVYCSFLHFYNLASKVATGLLRIAALLRRWHAVPCSSCVCVI